MRGGVFSKNIGKEGRREGGKEGRSEGAKERASDEMKI